MRPEQKLPAQFNSSFDAFRSSLIAMMSAFRHEANHYEGQDRAVLETSGEILALLENAYSEAVWLNHKLERRILRLDD